MKNDGKITMGVSAGIFIFVIVQSFVYALISGDAKDSCLKNGGVYTGGQTIAGITFNLCTYTK